MRETLGFLLVAALALALGLIAHLGSVVAIAGFICVGLVLRLALQLIRSA